ncbi:hypothetical protein AAHC03_09929 [Spirometra sp. Aus1]
MPVMCPVTAVSTMGWERARFAIPTPWGLSTNSVPVGMGEDVRGSSRQMTYASVGVVRELPLRRSFQAVVRIPPTRETPWNVPFPLVPLSTRV